MDADNYPISKLFVQQKDTTNDPQLTDLSAVPASGRIIALDPGTKRVGVAVCDELRVTTRPLTVITRESWKKLLLQVQNIVAEFDAGALVVGLPLESDGTESLDVSGSPRYGPQICAVPKRTGISPG